MAEHNANTVKAQIQSLIDLANTTTGNTDTNLTDGVNALVGGYGQGGSGGGSDDDLVTITFYNANGDVLKRELVVRNAMVYAPINANGDYLRFGETLGTTNIVTFPIIANENKEFYQLGKGISLPTGYCKYTIGVGHKTNKTPFYLVILPDNYKEQKIYNINYASSYYGLALEGTTSVMTGSKHDSKRKEYSTLEEALTELKNISDGITDISTLPESGNLLFYHGYTYYSNFDVYGEKACTTVVAPRNDYVYE